MRTALIVLAAALAALPAAAQQPGVPVPGAAPSAGPEDTPVNQRIVYGDDPCTEGEDPEAITICVRYSEDERFRVPPNLRNNPNDPASQAWANRAIELSYVGRTGTESCSTVGGGGFTGCFNQIVRQARAERAGSDQVNWARLIEEARQRRLAEIDAAAEAEEAAVQAEERANQPD
jgi:hypothetical protein